MSTNDRNDVSTEASPGPEENDNLGAEDGKGTPPTVPPTGRDHGDTENTDSDDPDRDAASSRAVDAENPADKP